MLGAGYAVLGVASIFDDAYLLGAIVILVWFLAASAHLRMSLAWIANRRLGSKYSRHAFALGIGALLALPVLGTIQETWGHPEATLHTIAMAVLMETLLMFPSIALAVRLNVFHAAKGQESRI